MINAGLSTAEQEKHTSQAFREGAEEGPSTISFSSLQCWGVSRVFGAVAGTQGAPKLLSASQAYSSVVWADLIDGREQKRWVG